MTSFHYWLNSEQRGLGKDKQLMFYLKQIPPYYPAHQLLRTISEIRLIQYVDEGSYKKLFPYVTVLPETTPININSAPIAILKILGNGLNDEQVQELLDAKGKKGFNPQKLAVLLKKMDIPSEQITLSSNYFLCVAEAKFNDSSLISYTIFKRTKDKNDHIEISTIFQSFNSLE